MRRLMLFRHAKTENDAPSGRDRDRRLDQRGEIDAAEMGGWIAGHPPLPDLVLVSTAVRAHQTWDLASAAMPRTAPQPKVELVDEIYAADPSQLLQVIHTASAADPQRLMLVGHNPGMHELAIALAGSGDFSLRKALTDNMPTAGIAVFDFPVDNWNDVAFQQGELVMFVGPKSLKAASG
jgi:phosphohistidine phosphatase